MLLLLILPVLVSGFIVCNTNPYYQYKLHRYEGQYLYLKSAHLGTIVLFIFSFSALSLNKYAPSSIGIFGLELPMDIIGYIKFIVADAYQVKSSADLTSFSWIIVISSGTVIFAYIWSIIAKVLLTYKTGSLEKSKILLMSKVLSDSPLDKLLFDSYIHSQSLLISLESGKVYVGTIHSLGEPNEADGMDQEISIIPLLSGFRDKNTLKVQFNTYYDSINSDLNIVIRQNQIQSVSGFNFDIYQELNPPTNK